MPARTPADARQLQNEAARLRQRQHDLFEKLSLCRTALPGSLALSHARCGRSNCHCAQDQGHPRWQLTFMVEGKKRVERIPAEWVDEVKRRVDAGRAFKETLANILNANADLLVLERKQRRQNREPIGRAPSVAEEGPDAPSLR